MMTEAQRKYRRTEKGKFAHRAENLRYAHSEKGRKKIAEYQKSEAYRQSRLKNGRSAKSKAWRRAYKKSEKYKAWDREYKKRPHVKARRNKYLNKKRVNDLNFRIRQNVWRLLRQAWTRRHGGPNKRASELLGCSIESFKLHIESLWQPGMSWLNYGKGTGKEKWNIDHVIPLALFDLSKLDHQKRAFHFSNHQPMWAGSNMSKGARVTDNQFRLL